MSTCQPGLKSVRLVAEPHDFKGLFQQKFFYDSVTRIVSLLSVSHHQYLKWVLLKSFGHRDCESFQTDRPWSFLLQIQFQNIYCGLMGNNLETTSFSPSAHWRKFFVRTVKNNSQWIKPAIWRHFPQFVLSEITGEKGECFDTFCLFFFLILLYQDLKNIPFSGFQMAPALWLFIVWTWGGWLAVNKGPQIFKGTHNHLLKN